MVATVRVTIRKNDLRKLAKATPRDADNAIEALAREGERYAKMEMNTSPPGRVYVRDSGTHVASQPGHPPNIDTGTLVNSISVEPRGQMQRAVVDGVEYGVFLEFGTRRMGARPFMGPMAVWLEGEVSRVFDEFLT